MMLVEKVRRIKRKSTVMTPEDSCAFELCTGPVTDASWTRLRKFTRRIHNPPKAEDNQQSSLGRGVGVNRDSSLITDKGNKTQLYALELEIGLM